MSYLPFHLPVTVSVSFCRQWEERASWWTEHSNSKCPIPHWVFYLLFCCQRGTRPSWWTPPFPTASSRRQRKPPRSCGSSPCPTPKLARTNSSLVSMYNLWMNLCVCACVCMYVHVCPRIQINFYIVRAAWSNKKQMQLSLYQIIPTQEDITTVASGVWAFWLTSTTDGSLWLMPQ